MFKAIEVILQDLFNLTLNIIVLRTYLDLSISIT